MATKEQIEEILKGLQKYGLVGEYDTYVDKVDDGDYYCVDDVHELIVVLIDRMLLYTRFDKDYWETRP